MIYLIGSLRNPAIPEIANKLRAEGLEVFDEWYSAGPEADDYWMKYEQGRGHTYAEALKGYPADHVFQFDKKHLERATHVILALPAGKSGHLELGWALGKGKRGYILLEKEPERYDVMYLFADMVSASLDEIIEDIKKATTFKNKYGVDPEHCPSCKKLYEDLEEMDAKTEEEEIPF